MATGDSRSAELLETEIADLARDPVAYIEQAGSRGVLKPLGGSKLAGHMSVSVGRDLRFAFVIHDGVPEVILIGRAEGFYDRLIQLVR